MESRTITLTKQHTITPEMGLALMWLYNRRKGDAWIKTGRAPENLRNRFDRLVSWGLIERSEDGARLTTSGLEFAAGKKRLPRFRVVREAGPRVTIDDCFEGRYSRKRLLKEGAVA
jgi:hypothetical protein